MILQNIVEDIVLVVSAIIKPRKNTLSQSAFFLVCEVSEGEGKQNQNMFKVIADNICDKHCSKHLICNDRKSIIVDKN